MRGTRVVSCFYFDLARPWTCAEYYNSHGLGFEGVLAALGLSSSSRRDRAATPAFLPFSLGLPLRRLLAGVFLRLSIVPAGANLLMKSSRSISLLGPATALNIRKTCISDRSSSIARTPSLNSSICNFPSPLLSSLLNASARPSNLPCSTSLTSSSAISSVPTSASLSYLYRTTGCLRVKEQAATILSAGFQQTSVHKEPRLGSFSFSAVVPCSPVSAFQTYTWPSSLPAITNFPSGLRSQRI
mmetsp:Transcript_21416/g.33511  ORF Transcript_21416/g.33511 Transcript_21416/m.33511 type:complete len:243 (+) Transcript_21416:98-826(+)